MSIIVAQKNDFTRKMIDVDTFSKMPKNVGDMGKIIVTKGFKKLPKVQYIAQSGHTDYNRQELAILGQVYLNICRLKTKYQKVRFVATFGSTISRKICSTIWQIVTR